MLSRDIRLTGIGGSEVAAVLGLDPQRDAFSVWAEKKGEFERAPATPRMRFGKYVERAIVDYYSELTERPTTFLDATFRHPERVYMVFTPDAVCVREKRGVDAKYVSWDQADTYGDTPDQIPARVQLQALWYLVGMDYEYWDVAAVVGSNAEPRIYTFGRDPELEGLVLEGVEEFYCRYIVGDERPPIGSSEDSTAYLRQRFPRNRRALRSATGEEVELLERYATVRAGEKVVVQERTRLENAIKLAIGDGDGLSWRGGHFTWKCTKDSTETDWAALADSFLRTVPEEDRASLIAEFTGVVPGVRRIHFHEKEKR